MHAACGRSSSEYRPHFDCSASWKMMIIIFDRKEGGGRRSLGFQICSVISRILQGPSDDFSRPKGNGVCIARGVRGKIPLSPRTKWHFFHQAFHPMWQSCHRASAICGWCCPVIDWEASKRNLDAAKKILLPVGAAHGGIPRIAEVLAEQCPQRRPLGVEILKANLELSGSSKNPLDFSQRGSSTPAVGLSITVQSGSRAHGDVGCSCPFPTHCSIGIGCTVLEGSPHLFILFNGVG